MQGGSNMTGTVAACLHTNQSRSYLNHLVLYQTSATNNALNLLIHQPTDALNKTQVLTDISLLHVSRPWCHPQDPETQLIHTLSINNSTC